MATPHEETMAHWLFPANTKFYDVFTAFNQRETFWPTNTNVAVSDLVFIYLAAPYKQIAYCCEITKIGVSPEDALPYVRHFFKEPIDNKKKPKMFMKLHRTVTFQITEDSLLSYKKLKQNGLSGMLMGARKLENNPLLLQYLKEVCNEL